MNGDEIGIMATGYISTSGVEATHGGERTLCLASMLSSLSVIEDMVYPSTHQLGNRDSLLRNQCSHSEHLLFCQPYLSPNHGWYNGRPSLNWQHEAVSRVSIVRLEHFQ